MARLGVVMQLAWSWLCPMCGETNFHEGEVPAIDADEREAMIRKALDIPPHEPVPEGAERQLVTQPSEVGCGACGLEFDVEAVQ